MRTAFILATQTLLSTLPHSPATSWVHPFPGELLLSQTGSLRPQQLNSLAL